jgi:ribA/ribD-fused uncharacterized protein
MPAKSKKSAASALYRGIAGTTEVKEKDLILFYHGPFSQWAPAEFDSSDFVQKTDDTKSSSRFYNAEQYMMAAKAHLFNDMKSLKRIMSTKNGDPRTVKELGRAVSGFDAAKWNAECQRIVTRGNVLKFGQDEKLKASLLGTGDKELAEASPSDKIWGIGLKIGDPLARDRTRWKGTNFLGKCLMAARAELRALSGAASASASASAASPVSSASASASASAPVSTASAAEPSTRKRKAGAATAIAVKKSRAESKSEKKDTKRTVWYLLNATFEHSKRPKPSAKLNSVPTLTVQLYESTQAFAADARELAHELQSDMRGGGDTDAEEEEEEEDDGSDADIENAMNKLTEITEEVDYELIDSWIDDMYAESSETGSITYKRHFAGSVEVSDKIDFNRLVACVAASINEDTLRGLDWIVHLCDRAEAAEYVKQVNIDSIDSAAEADETGIIQVRDLRDYFDENRVLKDELSDEVVLKLANKYVAKPELCRMVIPPSWTAPEPKTGMVESKDTKSSEAVPSVTGTDNQLEADSGAAAAAVISQSAAPSTTIQRKPKDGL